MKVGAIEEGDGRYELEWGWRTDRKEAEGNGDEVKRNFEKEALIWFLCIGFSGGRLSRGGMEGVLSQFVPVNGVGEFYVDGYRDYAYRCSDYFVGF